MTIFDDLKLWINNLNKLTKSRVITAAQLLQEIERNANNNDNGSNHCMHGLIINSI